jgi:deazaflavin-dependent oxidoreductase (nitroreductase family)
MTSEQQGRWGHLEREQFCYLDTVGRHSGRVHTIEIWFALRGATLYMLSGGRDRSDWVRNLVRTPEVTVRIADAALGGRARLVTATAEDGRARALVYSKYEGDYGGDLTSWRDTAMVVAVDLELGA